MYLNKKGELVALVIIGVLILAGSIFFVSQINNGSNGVTGTAVGLIEAPVNNHVMQHMFKKRGFQLSYDNDICTAVLNLS